MILLKSVIYINSICIYIYTYISESVNRFKPFGHQTRFCCHMLQISIVGTKIIILDMRATRRYASFLPIFARELSHIRNILILYVIVTKICILMGMLWTKCGSNILLKVESCKLLALLKIKNYMGGRQGYYPIFPYSQYH